MKTRLGFVSNSSSCSFYVALKEMPTTYDLAEFMIEDRMSYVKHLYTDNIKDVNDTEDQKYLALMEERTKNLQENLKNLSNKKNPNIAFRSTNFNTFITKVDVQDTPFLYVATCNNVQWSVPQCGLSMLGHGGDIYDGLYNEKHIYGKEFIDLDKNRIVLITNLDDMTHKLE